MRRSTAQKGASHNVASAPAPWFSGGTMAFVAVTTFAIASIAFIGVGFAGDVDVEEDIAELADDGPIASEDEVAHTYAPTESEDEKAPCGPGEYDADVDCGSESSDPKLVIALPTNLPKLADLTPKAPAKPALTNYERARRFADRTISMFEAATKRVESAKSLQQAQAELKRTQRSVNEEQRKWKKLEANLTEEEKHRLETYAKRRLEGLPARVIAALQRHRRPTPKHRSPHRTRLLNPSVAPHQNAVDIIE